MPRKPDYDRAFMDDASCPQSRKMFRVLSPKPNSEVKAQITSERLILTRSHYAHKKSYPCQGCKSKCPFCARNISPRYKYYAACVSIGIGKAMLLEVTKGAYDENAALKNPNVNLRGKYITLFRRGNAENSPVFCRVEECPNDHAMKHLPQPFDVRAAILNMWGDPFLVFHPETGEFDDEPPEGTLVNA